MSFHLKEIRGYLKRHKHYLLHLFLDICKLFWWKLGCKKIAVITTGSGGVGDYLWIRNYMPLLRQPGTQTSSSAKERYKVILIAMFHWNVIVEAFDKDNVDIIRYFESCQSPKKIEMLFFKLFKADVFLNFRIESMGKFVRSKKEYNNKYIPRDIFYEEKNNMVFSRFSPLPNGFKHTLPITRRRPRSCGRNLQDQQDLARENEQVNNIPRPFAVVVEKGNTQGTLSIEQTTAIVRCLAEKGYHILLNGDKQRLASVLDSSTYDRIIDGKEFSFPEYTWLVNECSLVVTVNTSIYHFAIQLHKPCVVISANEYETIKLDNPNQVNVFNEELQEAFEKRELISYEKNSANKLDDIKCNRIAFAIDKIKKQLVL